MSGEDQTNTFVEFSTPKGWKVRVKLDTDKPRSAEGVIAITDYEVFKIGDNGKRVFCAVGMGPHESPMTTEEPDGGVAVPEGLNLIDPFGDPVPAPLLKIVGAVFQDQIGKVALDANSKPLRFSFSNPDATELATFGSDGSVLLNGETWHLVGLHEANRNRLVGLVAYFRRVPRPGGAVVVSELAHVTF